MAKTFQKGHKNEILSVKTTSENSEVTFWGDADDTEWKILKILYFMRDIVKKFMPQNI